jgi:hypothetical protein
MKLEKLVKLLQNPTNYVIDIGSSVCVDSDPMYNFIISDNYKGVCIEGNREKAIISSNKISKNFTIIGEFANPDNILDFFEKLNVPTVFDILKIDIDGYDLALAKTILQKYKPSFVVIEYNEKMPPSIDFEVLYKNEYGWDNTHFYGFSISKGEKEFNKLNYSFYDIYDINNLLFINNDIMKYMELEKGDIVSKYDEHYKYNLISKKIFFWNTDVEYWLNIRNKEDLKKEIIEYYEKRLPNRNYKKLNIDFTC